MTNSLRSTWGPLLAAAVALGAAPRAALATPTHNVCVPLASGVPTREGPPKWASWAATDVVDHSLDDPRWLGASGHSFEYGSAMAPLHTRAVWAHEGTQDFLYLSFIVDLEPTGATTSPDATSPRDIFLGFHRVTPVGGELGYVFQFHLDGSAAGPSPWLSPDHCGTYSSCDESSGTPKNFWRVFADHGNAGTCGTTGHTGEKYERLVGATAGDPPFAWMTNSADHSHDAVLYWKLGSTGPLQNRWAVQIRIPLVDAGHPISEGIEKGATFFYEATAQVAGAGGGDYISIGRWPRELTTAICPTTSLQDFVVHEELGSNASCTNCSVDKFSALTDISGAPPATCDGGITIDHGDVGAVFDAAAGTDFSTVTPTNGFKAYKPDGTPGVNTVIAQPHNTTATAITAPLQARFRLASWGAAPWSTPDTGKWKDIRGSGSGVCGTAGPSPGTCGPMTIPATGKGAITFQWQLGGDTGPGGLGNSEYCQFGLTPPSGWACGVCTCTGSEAGTDPTKKCYADTDAGVQATHTGLSPGPCVSTVYQYDQCMLVELSAPNGSVDFVQQSTWNNMQFATMSVDKREALIDGRGLPVGPNQKFQDIYLVAMPRNMPASVPTGTTGTTIVQQGALELAAAIATPYAEDMKRLTPEQIRAIMDKLGHQGDDIQVHDERVLAINRIRMIMPDADYKRVGALLHVAADQPRGQGSASALTNAIYTHTDPETTASVVPTLEIYAYYRPFDQGHAYQPMTSFSMFLSHEGGLGGIDWEIDGAKKVAGNVYHLRIPIGRARRIQLRSQAIVPPEAKQPAGNPNWPCGCCPNPKCGTLAGASNMTPGLLVGFVLFGRKRKRRPRRKGGQPARKA